MGAIIQAILRFISFGLYRGEQRILEAGDRVFTDTPQGIKDAFSIYRDRLIGDYDDLRDAVAQLEAVVEEKRVRLEGYVENENTLVQRRDGALNLFRKAEETQDTAAMEKHRAAFERYHAQIEQIEEHQTTLTGDIADEEGRMQGFMRRLTTMHAEIQQLPAEQAAAIADRVSAQKIIELNDRIGRLQTSRDRGPIDAVLKANQELTAKARVSDKLAGTDSLSQDDEYAAAGRSDTTSEAFEQMLAARKAREETSSVAHAPVERPDISRT